MTVKTRTSGITARASPGALVALSFQFLSEQRPAGACSPVGRHGFAPLFCSRPLRILTRSVSEWVQLIPSLTLRVRIEARKWQPLASHAHDSASSLDPD
jgi:hypothetical protein